MSRADIINKLKTLSEGKISEAVAQKMAMPFLALAKQADFKAGSTHVPASTERPHADSQTPQFEPEPTGKTNEQGSGLAFDGLVYNIQIVLPESRAPAVYDALFSSLRTHLR